MYNRYIPGSNGTYERQIMEEPVIKPEAMPAAPIPAPAKTETAQQQRKPSQTSSAGPDLGDLLLLCIILLLLIDSDENDLLSAIILAGALFLQP